MIREITLIKYFNYRKGDMIVEVKDRPMQDMTLLDAYQVFRNLSTGPVDIVIKMGGNSLSREIPLILFMKIVFVGKGT